MPVSLLYCRLLDKLYGVLLCLSADKRIANEADKIYTVFYASCGFNTAQLTLLYFYSCRSSMIATVNSLNIAISVQNKT